MGKVNKIDSNVTGLNACEEASLGVLPDAAEQVWFPLEPNSYKDFGGSVKTVARNPINASRQRKKGVVVDVDASGGINTDVTQTNLQSMLQGFFFANVREKVTTAPLNGATVVITAATTGPNTYTAAAGLDAFRAGDLVLAHGFGLAANNGLKRVTASAAGVLTVSEALTAEAAPPAGAKLTVVGFQFDAADLVVTQTGGNLPTLTSTTKDFTQLGLIPGEWVFVGGDTATLRFGTAADNGFARVRSVAAHSITLDKTADTIVTDAGAGKTVQVFFGRVLKNESGTLIRRRSYHLERVLGHNNDTDITKQQAEYLIGSIPNQLDLAVPTADKVTTDLSFVSLRTETVDENISGANTLLTKTVGATLLPLVEADAFNTSSDVSRIKLSSVSDSDSCPAPLFAFVQELKLSLNNKLSPNKAIGVTGAFEVTAGTFEVGGSMTAYFADVAAIAAVQNNEDITLDCHFVKANAGISFDLPLLALGDGRPNIQQDSPITLPLENSAATGAKVHPNLNHTLLCVFWDFLPSLADV